MLNTTISSTPAPVVIFSTRWPAEFEAYAASEGVSFKRLTGSWMGQTEPSYLIRAIDLQEVEDAGFLLYQEATMHLLPISNRVERAAWLYDRCSGTATYAGIFRAVPKTKAMASPGWTFDPWSGLYFLAEDSTVPVPNAEPGGPLADHETKTQDPNRAFPGEPNWIC